MYNSEIFFISNTVTDDEIWNLSLFLQKQLRIKIGNVYRTTAETKL